ncbi:glutamate-1-semialdehyde 2,1-aminomutase [bacterium]|nr:glutamate-1-semialdehyde 2,1-aminomutase [bacterium]
MSISNAGLFAALNQRIPGGVNSPFRAFQAVGGVPPVLARGQGARVWDVEGNQYVDFCCAWGPLMLGHSHPVLIEAGRQALEEGSVFGASTPWELEFAEAISAAYPSMQKLRLVNSGAEAVASALRVARGATGRARILKFEGCYHGHVECLDSVGVEAEQMGGPLALGASPGSAAETVLAIFNDLDSLNQKLEQHRGEIAAVIIEPIPGSMAVTRPRPGFLEGVRSLCDEFGVLLIFDEVLSGCRVARGGAQELFQVKPDLTCLGKALAGGMPVGAYGGRAELMDLVAPLGKVYQAGTFCGNPLTVRCGTANLALLAQPGVYSRLAEATDFLVASLKGLHPQLQVVAYPGMFGLYFAPHEIENHLHMELVDLDFYGRFYHRLLKAGFYLPPSSLDAAGLSTVHTREDLERFVQAVSEGLS